RELVRMSDAVAARLRKAGLSGRTVTIKVRYHDFSTITRSHTAGPAIDTGPAIARTATALLDSVDVTPGVRLLGVSVTNLNDGEGAQLSFDDADAAGAEDWNAASRAMDEVRRRFGERSLGPAILADGDGVR